LRIVRMCHLENFVTVQRLSLTKDKRYAIQSNSIHQRASRLERNAMRLVPRKLMKNPRKTNCILLKELPLPVKIGLELSGWNVCTKPTYFPHNTWKRIIYDGTHRGTRKSRTLRTTKETVANWIFVEHTHNYHS